MVVVIVFLMVIVSFLSCIPWFTHISMVKDSCCKYGWASFEVFKKMVLELDGQWKWNSKFPNSLFHDKGKIHASIYKFNEIGMIMRTPIDFFMAEMFVRKYIRKRFNSNRIHKWDLAKE